MYQPALLGMFDSDMVVHSWCDTMRLEHRVIGSMPFPTGRIIVHDAMDCFDTVEQGALSRMVEPGRYSIALTIGHGVNGKTLEPYESIARIVLHLSDGLPSKWEMSTRSGEDIGTLAEDQYFGFGVDSGLAGLMDAETYNTLVARNQADQKWVWDLGESTGCGYQMVTIDESRGLQALFCFAGMGDGAYPTFWGLDERDAPCCLVIDFGLLNPPQTPKS